MDQSIAVPCGEADLVAVSHLMAALGRVRLLPGEDPQLFEQLRTRIFAAMQPRDIIEELFVIDLVHDTWDVLRHRRDKNNLLGIGDESTGAVLSREMGTDALARGNGRAQDLVILGEADTIMTPGFAATLKNKLHLLHGVTELVERAQAGRTMALRELQRHREAGAKVVKPAQQIEHAEFRTLDHDHG